MFAIFLSKAFIENIFDKENTASDLFDLFKNDFFSKLSISSLICDFDIYEHTNDTIRKILKSYMKDGVPFKTPPALKENLESTLLYNYETIDSFGYSDFKKLFFVHLPLKTIESYKHLKTISYISSSDFENSFNQFLISGEVQNETTQANYFKCKSDFNPFYCTGCNIVLIDDAYFLIKRPDKIVHGKIKEEYYLKQIEEFVDTFIEPFKSRNKTIVFMIPTYDYDERKLSWNKEEQELIRSITVKALLKRIPTAICLVYFHSLKTHSRKVLSNKHFYKMDRGFDFIKINRDDSEGLKEMVESIEFKSVYIKNRIFDEYFNLRVEHSKTKVIKYF